MDCAHYECSHRLGISHSRPLWTALTMSVTGPARIGATRRRHESNPVWLTLLRVESLVHPRHSSTFVLHYNGESLLLVIPLTQRGIPCTSYRAQQCTLERQPRSTSSPCVANDHCGVYFAGQRSVVVTESAYHSSKITYHKKQQQQRQRLSVG